MKERKLGIILLVLDVALVGTLTYFYLQKDLNAPRISIEASGLVYQQETTEEELLTGIRAMDAEDGEVTSTLVIEKIVEDPVKGIAVVTYGARDLSGNLTKISTSYPMAQEEGTEPEE